MNSEIIIGKKSNNSLKVRRPGYGMMRLTGPDFWGEPRDRDGAIRLLRKAYESGVNFFDTADFYGPGVTNRLLVDALHPYLEDLVIATKVGTIRGDDKSWNPYTLPSELRKSVENNLRELKLETLPLVHFGFLQGSVGSYEESFGIMMDLQKEGKILHLGLSNATMEQFNYAISQTQIATVENLYSYAQRTTDSNSPFGFQGGEVLSLCEESEIVFIPFFSLQTSLTSHQEKLKEVANQYGVSIAQLNIAWLIRKSDWILPIPGTTSVNHLQENIEAAQIYLTDADMEYLG